MSYDIMIFYQNLDLHTYLLVHLSTGFLKIYLQMWLSGHLTGQTSKHHSSNRKVRSKLIKEEISIGGSCCWGIKAKANKEEEKEKEVTRKPIISKLSNTSTGLSKLEF